MRFASLSLTGLMVLGLVGCGGGGGGVLVPSSSTLKTLTYTSASAYETPEYLAQSGLSLIHASNMYYNGVYSWYIGDSSSPSTPSSSLAGTGVGVTVGVVDSGINPAEANTGSSISVNTSASFDYTTNTAGSAIDGYGHGTHVSGIIAAPSNDSGMHGVAYNVTLANFKIFGSTGTSYLTDAVYADIFNRARTSSIWILNNSWGSSTSVTSPNASNDVLYYSSAIPAAQTYVANGGVVVFAAGNDGRPQPSVDSGLPYLVSSLSAGWLAVMAVDPSGVATSYTNYCGVAASWCLAAPGGGSTSQTGIYSMYNNGGYAVLSGTSMAAPQVSGALAGLKSMFPNLSYQQVRDRLLVTANKSGVYANTAVYGQGLMDLEAASSPVGGLSLPTTTSANGTVASSGSSLVLPQTLMSQLNLQQAVLMLDNYQRAPFWMPVSSVVTPSSNEATLDVRLKTAVTFVSKSTSKNGLFSAQFSEGNFQNFIANFDSYQTGMAFGFGSQNLQNSLGIDWLPLLSESGVPTATAGYSFQFGKGKVGAFASTQDISKNFTSRGVVDGVDFGAKHSASFVGQYILTEQSKIGISYSQATDVEKPLGISALGAFKSNSQLSSLGVHVSQQIVDDTLLKLSYEQTKVHNVNSQLLSAGDQNLHRIKLSSFVQISPSSYLDLYVVRTSADSHVATFSLPSTINDQGTITMQNYSFDTGSLLNSSSIGINYQNQIDSKQQWTAMLNAKKAASGQMASQIVFGYTSRW